VLLPSQELRDLGKRFDICLSGKTAPQGCDIRFRQFFWLMVFNDRGELMTACRLSDRLTEQKKLGKTLPEGLVSIVESGLKAAPSLEELERRYIAERGSTKALDALRKKIKAMEGVAQMRVAGFLGKAAPDTADPGLSRANGILMEAAACDRQVINHAAYNKLAKSIEGFIKNHPDHPSCLDLIEPLANVALKYTFDLRARSREYAKEWAAEKTHSAAARNGLAMLRRRLLAHCSAEVARAEKQLSTMKPRAYGRLRLQARLGRAQETLDGLDATKSFGVMGPIHAEWRRDAPAKLAREKSSRK